ncbi:peptidoglycan-binding protein [Streptomyces buecherae]|uniref:Peptidoglycan-binding protein n=1 Tax=Streptomyces buecherae TaxID=2763006 RepID=A0A7H8N809_9ACTN|nr:peptidoglycan-binding protein [Streptomyces buecherae]QKW50569.1 peptidoglycan-binding protein [Streptomyces buecherae]
MCERCGPADGAEREAADLGPGGLSRRGLLLGAGAGLGVALTGASGLASPAVAAPSAATPAAGSLKNGQWCNPARGHFPKGGHYGAPRGGGPHAGQDVTSSVGTAIYAAAAGTVIRRGSGVLGGRSGNGLVISHGGGRYTYYGHLHRFRVGLNAGVGAGQRIADMGATGNVTGPHLHFEAHSGGLGGVTNPVSHLAARGVGLGGGWPTLDPGAGGATVKALQYVLTRRGHELVADGDYGAVSVRAVRTFQSARELVADGQVGPKTWPHLVYTLRQGHSGSHVRGLRTVLNKHSAGLAVDGGFGSVTRTAVRAFQGANRLVVDGEAGPKTWTDLVG